LEEYVGLMCQNPMVMQMVAFLFGSLSECQLTFAVNDAINAMNY